MSTAIVSYDGTLNDEDALGLANVLRLAGLDLILAYVRHATLSERLREELEEQRQPSCWSAAPAGSATWTWSGRLSSTPPPAKASACWPTGPKPI
jgi:hypothetical protein